MQDKVIVLRSLQEKHKHHLVLQEEVLKKKHGQSKDLAQVKQHHQVNFLDLNLDLEVQVIKLDRVDLPLGLERALCTKFHQRELNKVFKLQVIKLDKKAQHLDLEGTQIIRFQELLQVYKVKIIKFNQEDK